jgi:hypothetical protein
MLARQNALKVALRALESVKVAFRALLRGHTGRSYE